jgi:hypothetical protein
MKTRLPSIVLLIAFVCGATVSAEPVVCRGLSDASGGVVWRGQLIVAGDERNELLFYPIDGGAPVRKIQLDSLFPPVDKKIERDLEGLALSGDSLYMIGSHSENKKGKACPSRRFFAALRLPMFTAVGSCSLYTETGINIEGIAIQTNGTALIGFRNPPGRMDTLENPEGVLKGEPPKWGTPQKAPGAVRDLCVDSRGRLLILVSGNRLFCDNKEIPLGLPADFNAEAVVEDLAGKRLVLISDDGTRLFGGIENKKLPPDRQTFRLTTVPIP